MPICNRRGQVYTGDGFRTLWQKLMRKALETNAIAERFTFHDLRAKAGSDSNDDRLLGHQDVRTLNRHYKRKATRVTPLDPVRPKSFGQQG